MPSCMELLAYILANTGRLLSERETGPSLALVGRAAPLSQLQRRRSAQPRAATDHAVTAGVARHAAQHIHERGRALGPRSAALVCARQLQPIQLERLKRTDIDEFLNNAFGTPCVG